MTIGSWAEFRAAYPNGSVLSRDTGFARAYGRNPYPGPVDGRFPAKTHVVGVRVGA